MLIMAVEVFDIYGEGMFSHSFRPTHIKPCCKRCRTYNVSFEELDGIRYVPIRSLTYECCSDSEGERCDGGELHVPERFCPHCGKKTEVQVVKREIHIEAETEREEYVTVTDMHEVTFMQDELTEDVTNDC